MRQFIADLRARDRLPHHAYLTALNDDLPRAAFIETQIQLYFAARAFAGPVLTLAARLGDPEGWQGLVDGLLQPEPCESALRGPASLRALIVALGVPDGAIDRRPLWPEVRAFNAALVGICAGGDPLLGLAVLGMVEDTLCAIGPAVGAGIVARGWLDPDALIHYPAAATLESARAEAFLARLDWPYARVPEARVTIRDGLETGDHLARRLLDDLHRARGRAAATRDRARTADIARRVRELASLNATQS